LFLDIIVFKKQVLYTLYLVQSVITETQILRYVS